MKEFGLKIGLFVLILVVISRITTFYLPYHWGNPWYSTKIDYLESLDNKKKYNTYFFGSSRVYRQINPSVFDSTCNKGSIETFSSFNLGAQATFSPQTYFLYENFLNSELSNGVQYSFLEITHIGSINDFFLHREQTNYWLDFGETKFVIESLINNPYFSPEKKKRQSRRYILSYIENTIHWGHFGEHLMKSNFYDTRFLGKMNNGFLSMDLDFETTNDKFVKDHFKMIKNKMLNDTCELNNIFEQSKNYYEKRIEDYDQLHYNRLLSLIELSKNKGIHLILFLSPRNASIELVNLMRLIPKKNKIDMAIPSTDNSPYYYTKNSFDIGHLNEKGANLYSKNFANLFLTKIHDLE